MDARRIRNTMPALYALAILLALLFGGATVLVVVLIAGGMLVGLGYTLLSGGSGHGRARPERAARRDRRR